VFADTLLRKIPRSLYSVGDWKLKLNFRLEDIRNNPLEVRKSGNQGGQYL